jgi:hypothetical protein
VLCAAVLLSVTLPVAFPTAPARADAALVYSTDFSSGTYASLSMQPPYTPGGTIGLTCSDAVARRSGDRVAIIGRFGCDYLQFVDPQSGFATTAQWSTGNGTNPYDFVTCDSNRVYVSLYERDYLLILDADTGQHLGQIDLSLWSDADGLPEASGMVRVGDRVFVALQRLDRPGGYVASHSSLLAVIDCSTDALVDADPVTPGIQAITLQTRNPFDDLHYDPVRQRIVVVSAGNFGVLDGGIESVDPLTLQSEGILVTEATLGGDLNQARLYVDCTGYAIVNDSSYNTSLVQFDHCNGTLLGTCRSTVGFNLADLEIDRQGVLYLAERDLVTPGVRLYQLPACSEITTSPLAFALPPQDILLTGDGVVTPTHAEPPTPTAVRVSPNRPEPFNPSTTFSIEAPPHARLRIEVVDVSGRLVRRLWDGPLRGAQQTMQWDGADTLGRNVASGVYFAVVRCEGFQHSERMTLVR